MAKKRIPVAAKVRSKGGAAPTRVAKKATKAAPRKASKDKRSAAERRYDLFVDEYLIDLNGAQAAIRAGYSPDAARQQASELLARPEIQAKVQAAMDARAERTGITQDTVLKRLYAIATADPRELIELHRGCCRYCWSKHHRYQWTPQELRDAQKEYEGNVASANEAQLKLLRAPDEAGGLGFDPRKDPNPACPECFGEGTERVVPKDTRDHSPAARLLYAGVKTTQHGLEIKMHDQTGMLVNVGKHLGMFKDRVELTGKDGGAVQHQTIGDLLTEIDGLGTGLPQHASAVRIK